jgi:ubiquinone/menaquinone biosynthesis C-methylase UbiE
VLKRIPGHRAEQLLADAAALPTSDPRVSYPAWYVHRWHFLPEGYLSRRSAAWYEHIVRNLYNQGMEGRIMRTLIDRLRQISPASLLEVGCGPGRFLAASARARVGSDRIGLDLSPFLLERARRRVGNLGARIVHGNGLAIPSEDSAFDAVVASHYVGHLPEEIRSQAITELARVVRPGGHLLVIDHRWHPWPAQPGLKLTAASNHNFGLIRVNVFERQETLA